jgi:glycosyltransferase involved in cell wall biosynthesis
VKLLITGSKEYPVGSSDDPIPTGGMEVYTQSLAKALVTAGHKPIVLTRLFRGTKAHEQRDGVVVERVPWVRGFFFRNLTFNFFAFFRQLSLDFDAVLANGVFASLFARIAKLVKGKPVVARCAGVAWVQSQYPAPVKWLLKLFESITYRLMDTVVFLSNEEVKSFERKMGFLPKRWVLIPTGVDFEKIESGDASKVRKEFRLGDDNVVLFVGRLIAVKKVDSLIGGFKVANLKGWRLVIVGDGPERAALEKLASPLGNSVVFTGTRHDTQHFYAAADIFTLVSESEGLPLSLLEAYAAGLPCVVTSIGLPASPENAVIVRPGDANAIAAALRRLASDAALRKKMGAANRKKARAEFSWENAVELYERAFRSLGVRD